MSLFSRFAKHLLAPVKSEHEFFCGRMFTIHGAWRKWKVPGVHLTEKVFDIPSKLLYICAFVGSCVLVVSTKHILCEENRLRDDRYSSAIVKGRDLIQKIKDEVGAPGFVVGVSVDGKVVWEEGFGYADIENRVPCTTDTVMRIASISKSYTMAAVAKLWEDGKLDLDKPIQDYVPYFPTKTFDGKPVTLTCRHLVSHLGGIRHYDKNVLKPNAEKEKEKAPKDTKDNKNQELKSVGNSEAGENKNKTSDSEFKEFFLKEKFEDIKSSLELFKDDPLVSKPGTKYLYSTHGWTLVSAIVEGASKEQFPIHIKKLFKELGMHHTYLDVNQAVIYNRSRNYVKDKRGHIINAPYVDNSYKWAGGGFLSTVGDLLQFGNSMLYSLQYRPFSSQTSRSIPNSLGDQDLLKDSIIVQEKGALEKSEKSENAQNKEVITKDNLQCTKELLPGYLNYKTMEMMWSPIIQVKGDDWYGMGWGIVPDKQNCQFCEKLRFMASHSGGAIGASSVLLVLPPPCKYANSIKCQWPDPPKGIVVSVFTNLQDVNITKTAFQIALIFEMYSRYL